MLIAVFSDTHGSVFGLARAVRRVSPDLLVHLGDCVRDSQALAREFPDLPLYALSGNCDYSSREPDSLEFMAGPIKVLATHGHRYNVKYGLDSLMNSAFFSGAKLVLYGHTHIAEVHELGGIAVMNPGSAGMGVSPSFGLAEISDAGAVSCRILDM